MGRPLDGPGPRAMAFTRSDSVVAVALAVLVGAAAVAVAAFVACFPRALTLDVDAAAAADVGVGDDGGCTTASDCPVGQSCDPATGACSTLCNNSLVCNGGCCDDQAGCQVGDAAEFCGNQGTLCASCSGNTPTCSNGQCTGSCSPNSVCGAGFCCGADGGCVAGNTSAACGSGGACLDCTSSNVGHACLNGTCGCDAAADCPPHQACDTSKHACTSTCLSGATTGCNGGCCDGGQCAPGGWAQACGNDGGWCFSCVGKCNPGFRCFNNGERCGCYGGSANSGCQQACKDAKASCDMATSTCK